MDEHHCTIAEGVSQSDCSNSYLCFLPSGETIVTSSAEECEQPSRGQCSQSCGTDCESKSGCEATGVCKGEEALWAVEGQVGACAFNKTSRSDRISGCKSNQHTFFKYCLDYSISSSDSCTAQSGLWLTPSLTQETCESKFGNSLLCN